MSFTDYLAIWGAFIGTVVAGWNIYKDFLQRDRVQVTVGFRIQFPPRQEVFVYQNHQPFLPQNNRDALCRLSR